MSSSSSHATSTDLIGNVDPEWYGPPYSRQAHLPKAYHGATLEGRVSQLYLKRLRATTTSGSG